MTKAALLVLILAAPAALRAQSSATAAAVSTGAVSGAQAVAAARSAPSPAREPSEPREESGVGWFVLAFLFVAVSLAAFGSGLTVGYCLAGTSWGQPFGAFLKRFWRGLPVGMPPTEPPARRAPPAPAAPALPARPAAALPLLRGRFELRSRIGIGGMGIVYDGFDHSVGRRVAVKQLRSELKDDPERRESFLSEARIISHLSHPYIVGFHEVIEDGGEIYLVFDFVDGKPLSQMLIERKRLPLEECQRIFGQVCEAIGCAHQSRVLHRDLKPSNIMVDTRQYVKVMDFGIAREAKESITRMTGSDISGTPGYMAPEQHLGKTGKSSDIYSLGVCLYEAMTGQLPFQGPDFLAQKERMKFSPPQFLAPELPKESELLFSAVFNPDPKKRVADAAELAESLRSLRSGVAPRA